MREVMIGVPFVFSEAFDFALENPIYLSVVAFISFIIGLEVSGYGPISHIHGRRRVKKLNDDLVRVRELQQQLGVLRAVREKRHSRASELAASAKEMQQPKRETKVRFGKVRKLDFSALVPRPLLSDADADDSDSSSSCDTAEIKDMGGGGAASHAYEAVKDTWRWGRHETPLSPILGWAEGLTSATVGLFGTDLKGIDDGLKPQVAGWDEHVVKPTISNVMKIFEDLNTEEEKKMVEIEAS